MQFRNFPPQQIGFPVRADWARKVIDAIAESRPRPRPGQTMSRNSYGVMLGEDPDEGDGIEFSKSFPFKVRWYPFGKAGGSDGEWQICLPMGCVTVLQEGLAQIAIPVNESAVDKDGNNLYKWYRIPDPDDEDADVGKMGKYAAKTWTVQIAMKPWPRFKATTKADDKDFGTVVRSIAVATIGVVERSSEKGTVYSHPVSQMKTDGTGISFEREMTGSFDIRYTMSDAKSPGANVKAELINVTRQFGRLQLNEKTPKDITGWKEVWVRITHKDTEFKLAIEQEIGADDISNDDQTVYKIYELRDGKDVVTRDMRDHIEPMDFYTNEPDSGS